MPGNTLPMNDPPRECRCCPECGQRFGADGVFCPFDGARLVAAPPDSGKDPLLGVILGGRYEVLHVLGEGGMGRVYGVRHTLLNRGFALKVLRRDLARQEELATRFIQEARATAAVRHPNIVSITDFGQLPDGTPYYVMERLAGQTLADVIRRGGPIPAGRAVRLVRQLAGALGAAHAAGIVHRDLKPDNVFLIGGVSGGVASDDVRVVDFGAAKVLGASRLTKTGIVFGTPHYMSPEQASGQPIDHRADIYALGIIMYEMFTGRVPFEGDTYMGVLTQHMFVQPVPPSRVVGAIPGLGALEAITLRALEKKPDDRYQSMEELAQDLDRVARFGADGEVAVAPQMEGGRPSSKRPPPRMADELEPPTLAEVRHVVESLSPPRAPLWSQAWVWVACGACVMGLFGGVTYYAIRPHGPAARAGSEGAATSPPEGALAAGGQGATLAPGSGSATTPSAASALVVTLPAGAHIYKGERFIGAAPLTLELSASGQYTAKAAGYADQPFVVDPRTGTEVYVELRRAGAPSASSRLPSPPAAASGRSPENTDDIEDPFVRGR